MKLERHKDLSFLGNDTRIPKDIEKIKKFVSLSIS
jgi:hypothetical protein